MNIEEAYRELGVVEGTSPDALRRAYLRQLKTRKPEVDPEGFQRLREAYEMVRPDGQWHAPEAQSPAQEPPPETRGEPTTTEQTGFDPGSFLEALDNGDARTAARFLLEQGNWERLRFPVGPALQVLLQLHQNNHLRLARKLQKTIADSHALADPAVWENPYLTARWRLARELGMLEADFPEEVREAIAAGVLNGDLGEARPRLRKIRAQNQARANIAELLLRQHAPSLHGAVANDLYTPRDASRSSAGLWPWLSTPIILVALGALRTVCSSSSGASTVHELDNHRIEVKQPTLREQEQLLIDAKVDVQRLLHEAEQLPHSENLVSNTRALSSSLATWQCNDIIPTAHEVKVIVWSADHADFKQLRPTALKVMTDISKLCYSTAGAAGLTEVSE